MTSPQHLEPIYERILQTALEGKRCPENGAFGISSSTVNELARAGRFRIEIYAGNFRRIVILDGEHAGKATMAHPNGLKPWKIIGRETMITNRRSPLRRDKRVSAPQVLPPDWHRS